MKSLAGELKKKLSAVYCKLTFVAKNLITIRYDTLLMQKAIRAHEHIYKYKYNHIQDSKLHTEQYHLHNIHVMECL